MAKVTTIDLQCTTAVLPPPEFFPLPSASKGKNGERDTIDPHFGLSRSAYYELEAKGHIRLVRVRLRGRTQGKVLVSYDQISRHLKSLEKRQLKSASQDIEE